MANSLKQTDAAALQAFVQDYAPELWSRTFYGFETAKVVSMEEGVKGKRILTRLDIANNLSTRWHSTFSGKADAAALVPRTLATELAKFEFSFTPTQLEQTYLGYLRQTGQNPQDFPISAFVLMKLSEKLKKEMEDAVWQAVAAGTPANTDALNALFHGYLKILADAITATTITPVATGAITATNAVDKFRDLWDQVDPAYKSAGTTFFCSLTNFDNYTKHYKNLFHQSPQVLPQANGEYSGMVYELGAGRSRIVGLPGLGSSGRVIVTPSENLVIGLDGAESLEINTEQEHWNIDMFGAYRLGVQIRTLESGILVVNNQA